MASSGSSPLITAIHRIQRVYEDAIWLVWYERGIWEAAKQTESELNRLEEILKECYDVIDLVTLASIERFGSAFTSSNREASVHDSPDFHTHKLMYRGHIETAAWRCLGARDLIVRPCPHRS